MSLILSSSSVSVLSDGFASGVGEASSGLSAGLMVTSNMAPERLFSSCRSRICMVSFGMVRRPSVAVFARNSSSLKPSGSRGLTVTFSISPGSIL